MYHIGNQYKNKITGFFMTKLQVFLYERLKQIVYFTAANDFLFSFIYLFSSSVPLLFFSFTALLSFEVPRIGSHLV